MKNSRAYTVISLLLLMAVPATACWYGRPEPINNMIYRLMEDVGDYYRYDDTPFLKPSNNMYGDYTFRQQNLSLWRRQTNTTVGDEELERLIYKSDSDALKAGKDHAVKVLGAEGYKLLCLAKQCEEVRADLCDPWYYPSKDDTYTQDLESIAATASRYRGRYLNRYALQAIRALVTLKKDSAAVAYWERVEPALDDDVIRVMAERHVAAAYYNLGQRQKAMHIYAKAGDVTSMYYVYSKEQKDHYAPVLGKSGKADIIRLVCEECPNSPFIKDVLQSILSHYDNDHFAQNHQWGCYYETKDEKDFVDKIIALAGKQVRDSRVVDKAMWYYTMAALYDTREKYAEALASIEKGSSLCESGSFMSRSFRVLRMFVEAKSCTYDAAYRDRLATDLEWLMAIAAKGITPQLRKSLMPETVTERWGDTTYSYTRDVTYYNQMYWSDAINRILAAQLAVRLMDEGKHVDALLVSNLGEYWLPRKAYGVATIRNAPCLYWITERNNTMALMADTCRAEDIVTMYDRLCNPRTRLDRLVAQNGKTDRSYWSDVIGTHYIAEHEYSKAARWLSNCTRQYQKAVGTWPWYDRDPFCLKIGWNESHRHHLGSRYDYKLRYARRMAQLKRDICHGRSQDIRAEAMVMYGVGLRNQTDWCWMLTRNHDYLYGHEALVDRTASQKWIDRGLQQMQDQERKAYLLRQFGRNREVQRLCYDTKIAKNMRAHCDLWRDYKKK